MNNLLLHICCGPCAIMPIKALMDEGFEVTGFFYNPNIQPLMEYLRRRETAQICADKLGIELIFLDEVEPADWIGEQLPRATSPERCQWCVETRVKKTWETARELGFSHFSSSLLYSRYQPHGHIKKSGENLSGNDAPNFIYRDFRKFWQDGIDLSREWELYRQPYCGCIFSEYERYAKKLARLKSIA